MENCQLFRVHSSNKKPDSLWISKIIQGSGGWQTPDYAAAAAAVGTLSGARILEAAGLHGKELSVLGPLAAIKVLRARMLLALQ